MCESKQTIARLFGAFADALDSMDDREFDLLIRGKAKLRLGEPRKTGKKSVTVSPSEEYVSKIAQQLNDAESREEARTLIASIDHPRKKDFLLLVAEICGVTVGLKDSVSGVEHKLIENVVGSKLRSKAIQKVAF